MIHRIPRALIFSLAAILFSSTASAKITFELIYDASMDYNGFFDPAVNANANTAKATLQYAANFYADRIVDNLTAITSGPNGQFEGFIINPGLGYDDNIVYATGVAANTVKVFVGARSMGGTQLAEGGFGGFQYYDATQTFANNAESRGQTGVLANPQTDFSLWGGSISFNETANWFYRSDTVGLAQSGKNDFLSVALHEFAHMMGFTDGNGSFARLINASNKFTGTHVTAAYGSAPPIETSDYAHWDGDNGPTHINIMSILAGNPSRTQAALMNPAIAANIRRILTDLDWAAFQDIGWTLARPGDASADGKVDFDDLLILAQNYNLTGTLRWSQADFTYDGKVDFDDLLLLAQNYNSTTPLPGDPLFANAAATSSTFQADWERAMSIVPEPTSALTLLALSLLLTRRRATVARASRP